VSVVLSDAVLSTRGRGEGSHCRDAVTFGWWWPTARPHPATVSIRCDISLDVGDIKSGFFSFDSKLKDPFSHFLNINNILIMHPVRYIFHKTSLKTQLTSIGQKLVTLQARRFWVNSGGEALMTTLMDLYILMPSELDSGIRLPVLLTRLPTKYIFLL